jgi:hypothetical protein
MQRAERVGREPPGAGLIFLRSSRAPPRRTAESSGTALGGLIHYWLTSTSLVLYSVFVVAPGRARPRCAEAQLLLLR